MKYALVTGGSRGIGRANSHPDGFFTHAIAGEINKQVGRLLAISSQHSYKEECEKDYIFLHIYYHFNACTSIV